jgi:hypothetical protein
MISLFRHFVRDIIGICFDNKNNTYIKSVSKMQSFKAAVGGTYIYIYIYIYIVTIVL